MATHFSILAWRIPWTEEPGGLWSIGSQKVRHNLAHMHQCFLELPARGCQPHSWPQWNHNLRFLKLPGFIYLSVSLPMSTTMPPLWLPFNYKLRQCLAGRKLQTVFLYLFFYKDCRMHVATKDAELGTNFKFKNQRIKHSVTRAGEILQLFPALKKKWPSPWELLDSSTQSRKQDLWEYGRLLIKWVQF